MVCRKPALITSLIRLDSTVGGLSQPRIAYGRRARGEGEGVVVRAALPIYPPYKGVRGQEAEGAGEEAVDTTSHEAVGEEE